MSRAIRFSMLAFAIGGFAAAAVAQTAQTTRIRGTIAAMDGQV